MFEAKGPPMSLSSYTKFVMVSSFEGGDMWKGGRKRGETCDGKRQSNNRNPLLSCAFC